MARPQKTQPDLGSIFQKTQPAPAATPATDVPASPDIPAEGRTLPVGVGLKESELALVDELALELGVARNALIRYAVRYLLSEYRAGRLKLVVQEVTKRKLSM